MSSGDRSFFLESGNLALDLLNTSPSSDGTRPDRLGSPEALFAWLGAAGLLSSGAVDESRPGPPQARILLTEIRRLRQDVARVARTRAAGEPVPPFAVYGINRVLDTSRTSTSVVLDGDDARLVEADRGASLLAVLVPAARAAADLIVGADPARIRQCASETCDRWFLDTSKGGRRKWCSMASCGNRAKAATHRRRHQPA